MSDDLLDNLLNEVVEDGFKVWIPSEPGEGIAGVVIVSTLTQSDFLWVDGTRPVVPTVTVQTKDGGKYRVIGYGAALCRELMDASPKVGDLMAVKYFGKGLIPEWVKPSNNVTAWVRTAERAIKYFGRELVKSGRFAGREYHYFGVKVIRNNAPTD